MTHGGEVIRLGSPDLSHDGCFAGVVRQATDGGEITPLATKAGSIGKLGHEDVGASRSSDDMTKDDIGHVFHRGKHAEG